MVKCAGLFFLFFALLVACIGINGCSSTPGPLKVTSTTLPDGNFGSAYTATVNATGGVRALDVVHRVWLAHSGALAR